MTKKAVFKLAIALSVIVFSLLFRMHFVATAEWDRPIRADAGQYYSIAWNLVHHGVFSMTHPGEATPDPDSYRGPGYPLLVALTMRLGGDDLWVPYLLLIQAVLGALSVALTMAIAKQWLTFPYVLVAGLLVAVWPHTVALSGLVLTETFFGFSLLLGIYLLVRACQKKNGALFALAGLVFGYSALINPAILLFPVIVGLFLALSQRRYAVLFLVCALILPTAWAARGLAIDTGRSSSGRLMENVFAGMEPDFDYLTTPEALAARSRVLDGVESYKQNPLIALQTIGARLAQEPGHYLTWYFLTKPIRFWQWSIFGHGDIYVYAMIASPFETKSFYRGALSICYALNPWLMGAAFLCLPLLLFKVHRHGFQEGYLPLMMVAMLFTYATALHLVLVPDPRYSTPYRPFEILLSLSALAYIHQCWRANRHRNDQPKVS